MRHASGGVPGRCGTRSLSNRSRSHVTCARGARRPQAASASHVGCDRQHGRSWAQKRQVSSVDFLQREQPGSRYGVLPRARSIRGTTSALITTWGHEPRVRIKATAAGLFWCAPCSAIPRFRSEKVYCARGDIAGSRTLLDAGARAACRKSEEPTGVADPVEPTCEQELRLRAAERVRPQQRTVATAGGSRRRPGRPGSVRRHVLHLPRVNAARGMAAHRPRTGRAG